MTRPKSGVTGRPAGPLRAPLDYLLGAPSRVAVLRVLAAGGAPVSQRELARRSGVQVRSAQQAIACCVALGVADRVVGGRDHLVSLNRRHRLAAAVSAVFDAEADQFRALRERLRAWGQERGRRRAVRAVLLFGSAARGDDGPTSDLDVLVVTADEGARRRIEEAFAVLADELRATFGVEARPLVMSRAGLRARWRRRLPPVSDIVRDGVPILGPTPRELVRG